MRKTSGIICFIAAIGLLFGACSKSESYANRIKKEKKLISQFFSDHNIEVLENYPENGVFKENQFYQDPSGVYINVVDSGNGKRANANNRAEVYFRFSETMFLPTAESDTFNLSNMWHQPISFKYGESSTYTETSYLNTIRYNFLSTGVTIPLQYVGENAIIKLIVPFKKATGSTYQFATYKTLYYGNLQYTKIIN